SVGLKKFRAQDTRHIASQPMALFIADKRPVAVAVGGDDSVEATFASPFYCESSVLRSNGFGVNRNELFRATKCHDLGAQAGKNPHEHIATDRRVLINPDAKTLERVTLKEIEVTSDVRLGCLRSDGT